MAVRRVVATTITATLAIVLILSLVFPIPHFVGQPHVVRASPDWFSENWSYRKAFNITGCGANQTDYQMKLTVHKNTARYLTGWSKDGSNPLVDPGDDHVWPAIVYSNTTYHLYMGHYSAGSNVTYWTASNGHNFTEHGSSPVITRSEVETAWSLGSTPTALEPHSVIYFNSTWILYFGALVSTDPDVWKIGYATSSNLVDWSVDSGPCLEPSGNEVAVADPHAVAYNSTVYLYYAASNLSAASWQLCGAWSDDGDSFTKYGAGTSYIIDNYVPIAYVALDDGITGIVMDRGTAGYPYDACFTSDGEHFSYYTSNPVLEYDDGIEWEEANLGHGTICKVGSTYYLYYVGKDDASNFLLGRASTTTVTTDIDSGDDVFLHGHCQNDFDDIRFTQSDGSTELDFWKEEYVLGDYAVFWIEFNSIAASPSSTNFYLYYGNDSATDDSSGADTFILFEDFEWGSDGTDLDADGWTDEISAGTSVAEIDTAQAWGGTRSGVWYRDGSNNVWFSLPHTAAAGEAIRFRFKKEDTASSSFVHGNGAERIYINMQTDEDIAYYDGGFTDTLDDCAVDTWELVEIQNIDWSGGTYELHWNGVKIEDCTTDTSSAQPDAFWLSNAGGTSSAWYDNIIVRNWCGPEPTWASWGEEETGEECSPSISLNTSSWSANSGDVVATSSNYSSELTYFTITNNSGGAVDITIGGADMIGGGYTWDLADDGSVGDMIVALYAGREGEAYNIIVRESPTYNTLVAGLADSGTQSFGLTMCTPTNFDDGNTKSGNVTLTVVCS